jgi:hypothetical protein
MAEESTTFSTGSLQTFVAGAFIVALLALGMSIYNFSRTTAAVSALLDLQAAAVTAGADEGPAGPSMEQVSALEARIKALEEAAAAATAAATPATP